MSLSDKMSTKLFDLVKDKQEEFGYFKRKDVKEFIKELKEELHYKISKPEFDMVSGWIDKLAGPHLVEGERT